MKLVTFENAARQPGSFREHHEEATKAGFSHPVMPWIVFFQNTVGLADAGLRAIVPGQPTLAALRSLP